MTAAAQLRAHALTGVGDGRATNTVARAPSRPDDIIGARPARGPRPEDVARFNEAAANGLQECRSVETTVYRLT